MIIIVITFTTIVKTLISYTKIQPKKGIMYYIVFKINLILTFINLLGLHSIFCIFTF